MVEHLKHLDWVQFIPFMLTAANGQPKLNMVRLIETLIIGAIVAGLTVWAQQQVLETKLAHIQSDIADVKADVRSMREDFYKPVIR